MEDIYRTRALEIIKEKTSIIISGGGTLGASVVSGIKRLRELGALTEIKDTTGSSIGSFLATALACGATDEYMKDTLVNLDLEKFQDGHCILTDIIQLIVKKGMNKTKPICEFAEKILTDLVDNKDITFAELYQKTGIKLTITYLSLKKRKTIYANHETEPDSLVKEAIVKSSAIPLFYEPVLVKECKKINDYQFDGGTMANYPVHYPRKTGIPQEKILGFKFISYNEDPITGDLDEEEELPTDIVNLLLYLSEVIRQQALKLHVHKEDWKNTVKIDVDKLTSTDFEMSEEQKEWLMKQGRIAVDKYVDELADLLRKGEYIIE